MAYIDRIIPLVAVDMLEEDGVISCAFRNWLNTERADCTPVEGATLHGTIRAIEALRAESLRRLVSHRTYSLEGVATKLKVVLCEFEASGFQGREDLSRSLREIVAAAILDLTLIAELEKDRRKPRELLYSGTEAAGTVAPDQ